MAEQKDMLHRLTSAQDSFRKLQATMARFALPTDQRKALTEHFRRLMIPTEQMEAMRDLAESFGPPVTQIENLRSDIAEHRQQLDKMESQLARMEGSVDRLATAAGSLNEFYGAWMHMATTMGWLPPHVDGTDDDADDEESAES